MTDVELECDETPSVIASVHARTKGCCELCSVKHFTVGGRDRDGFFHPLYQEREDRAAARKAIGMLAWCGFHKRDTILRVFQVFCEVVKVDDRVSVKHSLYCRRCIGIMRRHALVVVLG